MECLISVAEQVFVRHHFMDAVLFELAFDEFDQLIAGHGVEFDAIVEQEFDLLGRSAVLCSTDPRRISSLTLGRGGGLLLKTINVPKTQP